MTVGRLIQLLQGADMDADVTVSVSDDTKEDEQVFYANIAAVTIFNSGAADIIFNSDITYEDIHGEKENE